MAAGDGVARTHQPRRAGQTVRGHAGLRSTPRAAPRWGQEARLTLLPFPPQLLGPDSSRLPTSKPGRRLHRSGPAVQTSEAPTPPS